MTLTVHPLPVPAPLGAGLDLPAAVHAALRDAGLAGELVDGDVLVVASKVVALAEERLVPLPDDDRAGPGDPRRALARELARRVVVDHERVLVVETSHGLVCANAGLDTSNVPDGQALLLPEDPDASAVRLRDDLRDRLGVELGVVVGDTFGRPWREGLVEVAIGLAGVPALRDERGGHDLLGHPLTITVAAVADEIAGLADLVRDKSTPVPFVLVRGLDLAGSGRGRDLVRDPAHDLFPAGGPTLADHAVTAARPGARTLGEVDPRPLDAVWDLVRARLPETCHLRVDDGDDRTTVAVHGPHDPATLLAVGAALEDLRILAAARGHRVSAPVPGRDDDVVATLDLLGSRGG